MIVRAGSGAQVSLRCQTCLSIPLRRTTLALWHPPRKSSGFRHQHNESQADSPAPAGSSIVRRLGPSTKPIIKPPVPDDFQSRIIPQVSARPVRKLQLSERPLGRLHGHPGHKLRESSEDLHIDTLGRPAEVIVLRDAVMRWSPDDKRVVEEKVEPLDIWAQLQAERGLVRQPEVDQGVDEFRPHDSVLSWDAFKALLENIHDGFTTAQLLGYIQTREKFREQLKENRNVEVAAVPTTSSVDEQKKIESTLRKISSKKTQKRDIRAAASAVWPFVNKTAWMPGFSTGGASFDESPVRGYTSDAYTPKRRLVLEILRNYWNVEVNEIEQAVGELELELKPAQLELLINSRDGHAPLQTISQMFMSRNNVLEKIEAYRSRNVIRLTTTKEKAPKIVAEIENVILSLETIVVDAKLFDEVEHKDRLIEAVSRMTGTIITKNTTENQFVISGYNGRPQSTISSPLEVALQLLSSCIESNAWSRRIIARKVIKSPVLATSLAPIDRMTWRHKLQEWDRFTSPISKPVTKTNDHIKDYLESRARLAAGPVLSKDVLRRLGFMVKKSSAVRKRQPHESKIEDSAPETPWSEKPETKSSVLVGNIAHLHLVKQSGRFKIKPSRSNKPGHNIFVPTAPNLSRLVGTFHGYTAPPIESVVFKFAPSPWNEHGALALKHYPPLEMHLSIDPDTNNLSLSKVIVAVRHYKSDLSIPDRNLDLRFQQITSFRLTKELPQITRFFADSELSPRDGIWRTPPNIKIPIIPEHLWPLETEEEKGKPSTEDLRAENDENVPMDTFEGASEGTPDDKLKSGEQLVDVEYVLSGFEHRSTLTFDFDGWRLRYTGIDRGNPDGLGGELSLHPIFTNQDEVGITKAQKSSEGRVRNSRTQIEKLQEKRRKWQTLKFVKSAYRLVDALEHIEPSEAEASHNSTEDDLVLPNIKTLPKVHKRQQTYGRNYDDFQYFKRPINFTDPADMIEEYLLAAGAQKEDIKEEQTELES